MNGVSSVRARVLPLVLVVVLGLLAAPSGAAPVGAEPKPPRPVVSDLKHATGPVAGGTKVVVKGKHLAGAKKVLFGKVRGTSLTVKSNRRLTVVAPAHGAATVAVRVVTLGGKSKRGPTFTFVAHSPSRPAPTVTGVSPGSGPTAGGPTVTITGARLTDVTSVAFGGVPATNLTHVTPTELTVTAPSHAAGVVWWRWPDRAGLRLR